MIISLIGFMAAGKTTTGKALAESMKTKFIDLDSYIEDKEQRSVSEIFEKDGEAAFRRLEEKHLEDLLEQHILENPQTLEDSDSPNKKCTLVLSLGGGTVMSELCRGLIKQLTYCIYIKTDLGATLKKFEDPEVKDGRPLLAGAKEIRKTIEELYSQREPYYEILAQKSIVV